MTGEGENNKQSRRRTTSQGEGREGHSCAKTAAARDETCLAHVATVDRHGRVTARNPGRFDTIATARGLEARMTGMEVYPAPGRQFNDRFWSAVARGLRRPAAARRGATRRTLTLP